MKFQNDCFKLKQSKNHLILIAFKFSGKENEFHPLHRINDPSAGIIARNISTSNNPRIVLADTPGIQLSTLVVRSKCRLSQMIFISSPITNLPVGTPDEVTGGQVPVPSVQNEYSILWQTKNWQRRRQVYPTAGRSCRIETAPNSRTKRHQTPESG